MKVMLITRTPPRQGLLGVVPERWDVEEVEAESVEVAMKRVRCALGGEVRGVAADQVVTMKPVMGMVRVSR